MGPKTAASRLDRAVLAFVDSLDEDRRAALAVLFLNSHVSWHWYAEVIDRFQLRRPDNPLVEDIARLHPDEAAIAFLLSDFPGPMFEAQVILTEAREIVRGEAARVQ